MTVKCSGCSMTTICFSHSQSKRVCKGCNTVLCYPTGGTAKIANKCSFKKVLRSVE
ncbi:ribosomal protein S27 [Hamiltosporidium magnivora]|uniref:Ribosomal protein S27 n=1 Tax=Hamiltosporidium magnivora TaxID=148818 RepID=A0A4Q9L5M4_9MICR|nr:ribosomal protein S27 [Hamiltosporidium magnivora]TBU08161.1 ribosomal protein S27 [Hamiltosporidium magnivora]